MREPVMKRWIESLLIAVSASVVTLLVAWSAGEQQQATTRTKASDTSAQGVNAGGVDHEILQQLAMLNQADEANPSGQDISSDSSHASHASQEIGRPSKGELPHPEHSHGAARVRPEIFDRCVEVARDIDPALAKRLASLRQQNASEFEQSMRVNGRKLLAMAELKQRDPDLYGAKLSELRFELSVRQKAHELREARAHGTSADAEVLEKQLRTALAIQLGMSIKSRGEIICQLQERINGIRAEIEHQASTFNETVETRFRELVNNPGPAPLDENSAVDATAVAPR
jgi:hypothetical protein